MIEIGGECCSDDNMNSICDNIELAGNESEQKDRTEKVQEARHINISQLEDGINKSYYPLKKYSFEDTERVNLTGIENTFDVRGSTRFNVLKIKKDYNFIENEQNFTDFVQRRYDLMVKNWNIDSKDWIDYNGLTDQQWREAVYHYDHSLEKINIFGKDSFIETHLVMYDKEDSLLDLDLSYNINVWCTPEFVVEVYPNEHWGFYYYTGSTIEANRKFIKGLMDGERERLILDAEKVLKVCSEETEPLELKNNEIIFFGRDGFHPEEVKIEAGKKLLIHNENAKWEGVMFMLMRDSPKKTINGPLIAIGNASEVFIEEPGSYTLFSVEYGPRARIVVS